MTAWNLIESRPRDAAGRIAMTKRQRQMADTIRRLTSAAGYPPTVRELVEALELSGPNAVMAHLRPMRRKGWVIWAQGKARTLRVIGG